MIDSAWEEFNRRLDNENMKYWAERASYLKSDMKREHQGIWYLALSIVSIIGGFVGIFYGLAGESWIQKPYVMMGAVLVCVGMSIVIGGFGKVKG